MNAQVQFSQTGVQSVGTQAFTYLHPEVVQTPRWHGWPPVHLVSS
jgi:hypothetical protein